MTATTVTDIPVSEIDLSDTGFRITAPGHDIEHLSASILQFGITAPPLVLIKQDKYIVVSGFRRIKAALHAKMPQVSCRVMSKQAPLDTAALAAVTENTFSRQLTPAELIRATMLLLRFMDAGHIAKNATAIFNMPLNTGYINTLARIHAMPDTVLNLLDQGQISIKACKRLMSLKTDTQAQFIHLFSVIKVSSGLQMEIIAWANEICALEKINLSQLILESPLGAGNTDTPEQGNTSSGHKDMGALGKQFKAFLAQRRFPALTAAKALAHKRIKALGLDSGLQLAIAENFEAMTYTMQMEFKSVDEFKTRIDHLAELACRNEFQALVAR